MGSSSVGAEDANGRTGWTPPPAAREVRDLFVIIPVHNRRDLTRQCLMDLRAQDCQSFSVIVIDDGSTDGTAEMIRDAFPETILLQGDGNLWWTRAVNLGVREALRRGAQVVMTLNDDVRIRTDFVGVMLDSMCDRPRTIVGAAAVNGGTGEMFFRGARWDWVRMAGRVPAAAESAPPAIIEGIDVLVGRGLAIPVEVIRVAGPFAEDRLPHGLADMDFVMRAVHCGFRAACQTVSPVQTSPETTTGNELISQRSLRNYWRHMTGIKGAGNLRFLFWFVVRNCPVWLVPWSLAVGLTRVVAGYWRPR
jgi:glycosyltransferase involved in cell wall biosynthesis